MEDNSRAFSSSYDAQQTPSKPFTLKSSGSTSSGLRLVLPPLKSVLAAKSSKKTKKRSDSISFTNPPPNYNVDVIVEKRPPRPVKLKPLKEVLGKLISQIKKKDDYAFFLSPVDVKSVPGYLDVVKTPMDLGTMSDKVKRGRYRSLDEFADDLRLVTNNAKIFNPPGTIYHQEAEKIEAWGLEHINKAAGTVIQYEADWNIDIEREDDAPTVNIEEEEEDPRATPMEADDGGPVRSASVVSQQPAPGRRGPRGPYKKQNQAVSNTLSEIVDSEGRLPGSKDGVGAFPAGSAWASTMLALKLKGKRYKTKKERMRIEKEGPPTLPNGALDYTEMEDPFSVLSCLVPDPLTRPTLLPLYPPFAQPPQSNPEANSSQGNQDQSHQSVSQPSTEQPRSEQPQPAAVPSYPCPTSVPLGHQAFDIDSVEPLTKPEPTSRRHWTISRNFTSRQRGKDKDDDEAEGPAWQMPRAAHPTDFGSFAFLAAELSEEMRRRGMVPGVVPPGQEQHMQFDFIRDSLATQVSVQANEEEANKAVVDAADPREQERLIKNYWTPEKTVEAEEYIRDVVYGGESGLGYVRSLAEFMDYEPPSDIEDNSPEEGVEKDESAMVQDEEDIKPPPPGTTLDMPLATWVERNIVDPLTGGRHSLVKDASAILYRARVRTDHSSVKADDAFDVRTQVKASLDVYPTASASLAALLSINMHKIDMGVLLKTPGELFVSEEEWYGKELKDRKRKRTATTPNGVAGKVDGGIGGVQADVDAMEVEEAAQTWVGVDANLPSTTATQPNEDAELEGPEELKEVLDYSAAVILDLNRRNQARSMDNGMSVDTAPAVKSEDGDGDGVKGEDLVMRNLRLNLLALAKRAPLDTIARLPKDLVPEHIRQYVPTLGSST